MAEQKPFWFCKLIVEHHVAAFIVAVLVQSSFVLLTVILYLIGSNVLPVDFSDVPLVLDYEPSYRRVAAWNLRNLDPKEPMLRYPSFLTESEIEQQTVYRQQVADVVELYYETTDGENILSYKFLKPIYDFEKQVLYNFPYYDKFCVLNENNECNQIDSITRFFPHLFNDSLSTYRDERLAYDKNISRTLFELHRVNDSMKKLVADYLKADTRFDDSDSVVSNGLRSYMLVSWVTYAKSKRALDDHVPEDTKDYGSLILSERFWNYSENGLPTATNRLPLSFYYYNAFLYYDRLSYQCSKDQMLAVGSFLFIFVFLWLQTRSLFVSAFGMYSILTNFCGANLVYRYVFDYQYFGVFNALAIFLILAIGVDEIFVFEECWCAGKDHKYPTLAHRLSTCYRKCSLSIFIPTVTTAAALVQNSNCPLLALSSFGLFAVNLVVLNYLSIITCFPCILIFYHYHFDKKLCKSECCKVGSSNNIITDTGQHRSEDGVAVVDSSKNNDDEAKTVKLSHKFCTWYLHLVWSKTAQIVILVLTCLLVGFFVYQSTTLKIDEEPPRLFSGNHLLGASLKKRNTEYSTTRYFENVADFIRVYLIWGISDLNRSMCHKTNWSKCRGDVVWDENFDLNSYSIQKELLELCQTIKNAPPDIRESLKMRTAVDGSVEIDCFMDGMDKYFNEELKTVFLSERKYSGLPATDVKVEALMMHVPQIFNVNDLLNNSFFYRYFEIANLYWLNDGYKFLFPYYSYPPPSYIQELKSKALNVKVPIPEPLSSPQFTTNYYLRFAHLLGHSSNSADIQKATIGNYSFVYGTKLKYAAVIVNTTIPILRLPYKEGIGYLDKWESYFNSLKANMSYPLRGGFVATPDSNNDLGAGIWHWMKVQEMMVFTAWQGIVIGLCLALPILVLFIDDVLLGALATLMIAFVSVCIIGIIPLVGWKLGLLEALNITLVADLAIDHIVHIAEGYKLSTKPNRKEKVEELLHEIGISIFSGAITTLGASSFLFFTKIVFFMQFGIFIFITVAFSMLFALGTFVVLLALIGPNDDRFSFKLLTRRLCKFILTKTGSAIKYVEKITDDKEQITASSNKDTNKVLDANDKNDLNQNSAVCHTNNVCQSSPPRNILPTISSNEKFLITRKIDNLNTGSRSIDDDNLSSGYDSGSVKHLAPGNTALEISDLSDTEDIATKTYTDFNGVSFRPKFSTIPEESRSARSSTNTSQPTTKEVKPMYTVSKQIIETNLHNPVEGQSSSTCAGTGAVSSKKATNADHPI